jgi:hypothetical protein
MVGVRATLRKQAGGQVRASLGEWGRERGARCQLRVRGSGIPCLRSLPVVSVKGPRPRTPTPRARASTAVCPAGFSPYAPPFRRLPERAPKQLRPGVVCRDCASFRHASRICETCVAPNGESCERTNTCGLGAPAHRPFARNRRGCRWVFRSSLTSTRNTWPVIGNPVSGLFFGDDREDAVKNSVMPECPRCHGSGSLSVLERIKRRFIDRLVSVIWPRHRYHCRSMGCGWEGNLPAERVPLLSGHSR